MKVIDWSLVLAAVIVVALVLFGVVQPYFEARTFNKFTSGPKATYWDALWAELRVTHD